MPVLDHLSVHRTEHERLVRDRELARRAAARLHSPEAVRCRPGRLALLRRRPPR